MERRGRRRWLMSFRGIDTRDQAESLRGAVLAAAPLVDPEALWVHELIGSEVVDLAGSPIGVVEAVESNPASDLLVLAGRSTHPPSLHHPTPAGPVDRRPAARPARAVTGLSGPRDPAYRCVHSFP